MNSKHRIIGVVLIGLLLIVLLNACTDESASNISENTPEGSEHSSNQSSNEQASEGEHDTNMNENNTGSSDPNAKQGEEKVTLLEGASSVIIANSEITMEVRKFSPTISSIMRNKGEYQGVNLLKGGEGYYLLNYGLDGEKKKWGGSGMSYKLISKTEDRVEISVSVNHPKLLPFEMDYRFVLEADSPGFYVYSIFKYPENMPDGLEIEQSRYSFRLDPNIFTDYGIEDRAMGDRIGKFPSPKDVRRGDSLMDATYRLPDGEIYTKYQHSVFMGDNNINGVFGEDIGFSIIRPSTEYLVGGPAKHEYLVEMTDSTPMVHWYEQVRHYGTPSIYPEKGWEKVYGPFFVYINEGDSIEDLWKDAKQKTEEEITKWPYEWVEAPAYAAEHRSQVSGQLEITDGTSAENARVILGQPGQNFYEQNLDYLYYTQADREGRFTLPAVREGDYTLYAYVNGVFGEYRKDGIQVNAKEPLDLGVLEWEPVNHGELAWQIGIPDRTPREFKYGENLHQWGLWLQYPLDFPEDVNFTIGKSDERTDWNYAHPMVKTPGKTEQLLVPANRSAAVWNIIFDREEAVSGTGTLTIAIAGSSNGSLNIELNGTQIASYEKVIPIGNDASLYRAGEAGYYNELIIPFDASLLREGENVISLKPLSSGGSTDGILYDALKLEVDVQSGSETVE